MKLSEKIYTCRKKAGLSQEALAEKLGVSRQAVSKWETGEAIPELMKIPSMAKLFGVTTDWLLSEEETFDIPPISDTPPMEEAPPIMEPIPSPDKEPPKFQPHPMRHTWIIGVVIACLGIPFVLVGAAALIFTSVFTKNTTNFQNITSEFNQEFVFPDGSVPAQWDEEMDKFFFADGSMLEEFLESTETTTPLVETRREE